MLIFQGKKFLSLQTYAVDVVNVVGANCLTFVTIESRLVVLAVFSF